ncbi:unnamed protein product, partial [Notodromas monacha]
MLTTKQGGAHTVLGTPYYISPEMGSFAPIKGPYSPLLKQLVRDMLQRDPEFRPSATEIDIAADGLNKNQKQPRIGYIYLGRREERTIGTRGYRNLEVETDVRRIAEREGNYEVIFIKCISKEVAVSRTHVIVLTTEGFSAFASDSGIVMTCGEGNQGCLGHGDWNSSAKPKLIQQLLSVNVCGIACGSNHVVVVGEQGDLYAWGVGLGGRLGLGHEDDCCGPQEVPFPGDERDQADAMPNNNKKQPHQDGQEDPAQVRQNLHGGSGSQPNVPSRMQNLIGSGNSGNANSRLENSLSSSYPEAAYMGGTPRDTLSPNQNDMLLKDSNLEPQEVLVLYASPAQVQKGETVNLAGIHCQNQNIFLVVDTTVPIPRVPPPGVANAGQVSRTFAPDEKSGLTHPADITEPDEDDLDDLEEGRRSRASRKHSSVSQKSGKSRDDFLNDSYGPMPEWLREELKEPRLEIPKSQPMNKVASADDLGKYYSEHLPGSPSPDVGMPKFPVEKQMSLKNPEPKPWDPQMLTDAPSPQHRRRFSAPGDIHKKIALANKALLQEKAEHNTDRERELRQEILNLQQELEV